MKLGALIGNQTLENCQYLLPVLVNAIEVRPEGALKIFCSQPFIDHSPWHVDILAQRLEGVPAQEQAIEKGSLALRRHRIGIVSWGHGLKRFAQKGHFKHEID